MEHDTVVLAPGLAQQLEFALNRNGWTRADVHTICKGDALAHMKRLMKEPNNPIPELKGLLRAARRPAVWKTIVIGELKTPDELITKLTKDGYKIWDETQDLLRQTAPDFVSEPTEIDLAYVDIKDLELPLEAAHVTVCRVLRKHGYELCTAQIGAEARRNYDEQGNDDSTVFVAMEPIEVPTSEGKPQILSLDFDTYIEEYGDLILASDWVEESRCYSRRAYICVVPR